MSISFGLHFVILYVPALAVCSLARARSRLLGVLFWLIRSFVRSLVGTGHLLGRAHRSDRVALRPHFGVPRDPHRRVHEGSDPLLWYVPAFSLHLVLLVLEAVLGANANDISFVGCLVQRTASTTSASRPRSDNKRRSGARTLALQNNNTTTTHTHPTSDCNKCTNQRSELAPPPAGPKWQRRGEEASAREATRWRAREIA